MAGDSAPHDIEARLDPGLRHLVAARVDLSAGMIAASRTFLDERRRRAAASLDTTGVRISETTVPAATPVRVRIYRGGESQPAPVVLYCHSGAFVLGNLDIDHRQCVEFARRARCTVVAVDYRLAPEHPFPAAFQDVSAVLAWVVTNAVELHVDPHRVGVAGNSAGGSLAAQLAQAAGRGDAPPVVFQLLHQPVLDDRPTASKDEFLTTPGFDGPAAALMWTYYLAGRQCLGAVPARTVDLTGLPSALVTCSELDPLRDEALDYARRLTAAGAVTELHVFGGTCHGFDSMAPDHASSRLLFDLQGDALRRALHTA